MECMFFYIFLGALRNGVELMGKFFLELVWDFVSVICDPQDISPYAI